MSIDAFVDRIARPKRSRTNVTAIHRIEARPPDLADWPATTPDWLRDALQRRGVERPYRHQADAWEHLAAGDDLVVVTRDTNNTVHILH